MKGEMTMRKFRLGLSPTIDFLRGLEEPAQRTAKWIRGENVGPITHLWACSACGSAYQVTGIYTPIGLGYHTCPNCNANMEGIEQ